MCVCAMYMYVYIYIYTHEMSTFIVSGYFAKLF